jgi:hypothetical protein
MRKLYLSKNLIKKNNKIKNEKRTIKKHEKQIQKNRLKQTYVNNRSYNK